MMNDWKQKWERRRLRLTSHEFGLLDVIKSQYQLLSKRNAKNKEILRLSSKEAYENTERDILTHTPVPFFASKFCRQDQFAHILAASDEKGKLTIHDINSLTLHIGCAVIVKNAIFDLLWMPGEMKVLALCGDHKSYLYDVGEGRVELLDTFVGHSKSVKTGDFLPGDSAVFATGSRDGQVLLFDSRALPKGRTASSCHFFDQCIAYASSSPSAKKQCRLSSVTGLAFQDKNSLLCCGSMDEYIRTWDLRMTYCDGKTHNPRTLRKTTRKGYNDLKISSDKTRMYASSFGGPIFSFNLNSSNEAPIAKFNGHFAGSYYVKSCLSPDGEFLASGSTDDSAWIWNTAQAELEPNGRDPYLRLPGHFGEVTGVDVSNSHNFTMVSCGEDGQVRSWRSKRVIKQDDDEISDSGTVSAEIWQRPEITRNSHITSPNRPPTMLLSPLKTPSPTRSNPEPAPFNGKRKLAELSPNCDSKRQVLSPSNSKDYQSPTMNLPNYVLEGTGPWHSCSRIRQKDNLDWLTEMRRKSADKRSKSVEQNRRRKNYNLKKPTSRKTLFEFYKKSTNSCDTSN